MARGHAFAISVDGEFIFNRFHKEVLEGGAVNRIDSAEAPEFQAFLQVMEPLRGDGLKDSSEFTEDEKDLIINAFGKLFDDLRESGVVEGE